MQCTFTIDFLVFHDFHVESGYAIGHFETGKLVLEKSLDPDSLRPRRCASI